MSFRRKLLLAFALTVLLSVSTVAWIASVVTQRAFEQADSQRSAALVAQFQREFARRGHEVLTRVQRISRNEVRHDWQKRQIKFLLTMALTLMTPKP